MDPATIAALIGAGSQIFGGLLGNRSANKAAARQSRADRRAYELELKALQANAMRDTYLMRVEQAKANQRAQLRNGFLRSLGVTGLVDPTVDMDAFNAPPPDINFKGSADEPGNKRGLSLRQLYGGTPGAPVPLGGVPPQGVMPPSPGGVPFGAPAAPPMALGGRTLGDFFYDGGM